MGKDKKAQGTSGSTPTTSDPELVVAPGDEQLMTTDAHVEGHGVED